MAKLLNNESIREEDFEGLLSANESVYFLLRKRYKLSPDQILSLIASYSDSHKSELGLDTLNVDNPELNKKSQILESLYTIAMAEKNKQPASSTFPRRQFITWLIKVGVLFGGVKVIETLQKQGVPFAFDANQPLTRERFEKFSRYITEIIEKDWPVEFENLTPEEGFLSDRSLTQITHRRKNGDKKGDVQTLSLGNHGQSGGPNGPEQAVPIISEDSPLLHEKLSGIEMDSLPGMITLLAQANISFASLSEYARKIISGKSREELVSVPKVVTTNIYEGRPEIINQLENWVNWSLGWVPLDRMHGDGENPQELHLFATDPHSLANYQRNDLELIYLDQVYEEFKNNGMDTAKYVFFAGLIKKALHLKKGEPTPSGTPVPEVTRSEMHRRRFLKLLGLGFSVPAVAGIRKQLSAGSDLLQLAEMYNKDKNGIPKDVILSKEFSPEGYYAAIKKYIYESDPDNAYDIVVDFTLRNLLSAYKMAVLREEGESPEKVQKFLSAWGNMHIHLLGLYPLSSAEILELIRVFTKRFHKQIAPKFSPQADELYTCTEYVVTALPDQKKTSWSGEANFHVFLHLREALFQEFPELLQK
jgi:hypothetical protein